MQHSNIETISTSTRQIYAREIIKHSVLFIITFITTTISGMMWQMEFDLYHIERGFAYSVSLLFILSCHEFGHYFAARTHKVKATLPYYIPFPPVEGILNFGTLGAVIRTKQRVPSRKALFDIGISGPIAGFIASVVVLVWGFTHLPGPEFLLNIHPDYDFATDQSPSLSDYPTLVFGSTLLYSIIEKVFATAGSYVPPMSEMYHYPFLITGWFGLFVTALNLLPASQLDGGHIAFAMFGTRHKIISRFIVVLVLCLGVLGMLPAVLDILNLPDFIEDLFRLFPNYSALFWPGWLFWGFILAVVFKIDHPPVEDNTPLDNTRMLLGWVAMLIFILSISPAPIFFQ